MPAVNDILVSEEWGKKTPLEKAAARKDLFEISLKENPSYAQQFNQADSAGQQAIYDSWTKAAQEKYPDAWTTKGFIVEKTGENNYTSKEVVAPVYDFRTEAILQAASPGRDFDTIQRRSSLMKELNPEAKKALLPFYAQRYGTTDISDLGDPKTIFPERSKLATAAELAGTTALRVGPVLLASPTRNAKLIAASAALGEGMAESMEQMTGSRESLSPAEIGLNSVLSLFPTTVISRVANPYVQAARTVGARTGEGIIQAALFEGGRQALTGENDPTRLLSATAVGGGLGGLLGTIESRYAARFAGKNAETIAKELPDLIKTAETPEARAQLTALQERIEQSVRPSGAQPAAQSAEVFSEALSAPAPAARNTELAQREVRAADFDAARAEEIAQQAEGIAPAIEQSRLAGPEQTQLGEDVLRNQITAIETRPGESARERARVESQIASQAPQVDVGIPENIQLSADASRMMEKYGRVNPAVMASLAGGGLGGTAGAIAGFESGDTPEEKIKNALFYGAMGFLGGAGAGYGAGRALTPRQTAIARKLSQELPSLIESAPPEAKADLIHLDAKMKRLAPAIFIGVQEGVPSAGIPNRELYNLTENAAGTVTNSTVSRQTLEDAGFRVPPTPPHLQPGQRYEIPVSEFDRPTVLPPDAQFTVIKMGGRTAVQLDIPAPGQDRPGFSGSPEQALEAGYAFKVPDDLPEGIYTYEQLTQSQPNEIRQTEEPTPATTSGRADQEAGRAQAVEQQQRPVEQVNVPEDSLQGAAISPFASTRGSIDPDLIKRAMLPAGGALAGATYGASEGDTPQERAANAMRWGLLGFGALSLGGRLIPSGTTSRLTKYAKELAQGTDALPNWFLNLRDTDPIVRLRETIGNNHYSRIKRDVSNVARAGGDIPEGANPYLAARLYPGVVHARIQQEADEAAQAVKKNIDSGLDAMSKASGIPYEQYAKELNDYIVAKTAKARNARLREPGIDNAKEPPASGMTDERADAIIADIDNRGLGTLFEDLRKQVRQLNEAALDARVDSGLISPSFAAELRRQEPDYVPLNRVMDEDADSVATLYSTPKFSSKSSGIQKAKGSQREVEDVLTNSLINLKDAIIRSERNTVAQSVRDFYSSHPNSGVTVTRAKGGNPPKNTLAVRYNDGGVNKTDWVTFDDPLAFKYLSMMDAQVTDPLLRTIGMGTNAMTQLMTKYHPAFFAVNNPIRDRMDVFQNLLNTTDLKTAVRGSFGYNPFKYVKAVSDAQLGRSTPEAALYHEAAMNGAFTGGFANTGREEASATLDKVSLDRSTPAQIKDRLVGGVEFLNDVANNANFLRVYEYAKKTGATPKEAAMLARNSSMDFNLKSPAIKRLGKLYGFIGPGVQGLTTATKNLVRNPAVIAEIAAGFTGIAMAVEAWNSKMDPNWKDKKQVDFYRQNSIPIAIGREEGENGGTYYLNIPVNQAARPVKAMADMTVDTASGTDYDSATFAKRMASVTADAMNPIGGSGDIYQTLSPTIADPMVGVATNTSYTGGRVYPEYSSTGQDRERVFDRTFTTASGRAAIEASKMMKQLGFDVSPESILYTVRGYGGGPASQAINIADEAFRDETINPKKGAKGNAMLRSFVKFVPDSGPNISTKSDQALEQSLNDQADRELLRKQVRAENMATLKNEQLPIEQKRQIIAERIRRSGIQQQTAEDLVNAVKRDAERTANPNATQIQSLQVQSGERAKYIWNSVRNMEPAQRAAFVRSLPDGTITNEVVQQIAQLIQQEAQGLQAPQPATASP